MKSKRSTQVISVSVDEFVETAIRLKLFQFKLISANDKKNKKANIKKARRKVLFKASDC